MAGVLRRRSKDDAGDVSKDAKGASWAEADWPHAGQWRTGLGAGRRLGHRSRRHRQEGQGQGAAQRRARSLPTPTFIQATRDSVRAIMMIRAYRMRGHLHANLDPLGIAKPLEDYNELSPELRLHRGRLRPQDLHRQRARSRIRDHPRDAGDPASAPIARRSASSSCTSPIRRRRPGSRSASKARTRASPSPPKARRRSCRSWSRPKASSSSSTSSTRAPSVSASMAAKSLIPALEQIIKRGGSLGLKEIVLGMAHRGRLNVLTQVMAQAAPRDVPRVQGRLLHARRCRRLGRREVPSRCLVGPRVRRQQGAPVADGQPLASRDRRSGRHGQGARQAGPAFGRDARARSCR